MTTNDLLEALARLRVETGSLACLGCGHEHNCSTKGCAILRAAADLIERLTAENAALREKQRWIPVTERMPEERVLVNVVWVNRAPEPYYERIKNVPFSGTACFYRENWYWDSPVVLDLLAEYGEDNLDLVDDAVEITHWMPLPEAPEEGEKA